jgi:uncharacterized protein YggE
VTETDARFPEIVTEGTGWHEQPGDQAELDVSFTATARNRSDAVRELNQRVGAADPAVRHPGLVVKHRRFWVHNEWRGNRVVGCRAAEDIALLLTDLTALEDVLSALVAAEPTDLNGPRWILADPAAAQREAQHRAVADARQRAEGYAAALNGRLGALRRLSEAPDHGGPVAFRMAAHEAVAPDVRDLGLEPEPVRITARCTTSWDLIT